MNSFLLTDYSYHIEVQLCVILGTFLRKMVYTPQQNSSQLKNFFFILKSTMQHVRRQKKHRQQCNMLEFSIRAVIHTITNHALMK